MAGAEIENLAAGVRLGIAERAQMPLGQIDDVDIIADAGAVGRVVVIAEDSFSRRPMATCVIYGIRLFGMPFGFSPIRPDGCAPMGLK